MPNQTPPRRRVVVDGSNIATEGRSLPSLAQLDEAIRSFLDEFQGFGTSDVTVVVDASFGHRIDPSEVPAFEEAVLHGEMVTPPAGAVGRGDGFILRIAEKSGALVLSNDSFQEFHAERPWLFEAGRLIGGKPVPGVGWIFTPRTPVRGAMSRTVTGKARRDDRSRGEGPERSEAGSADGPAEPVADGGGAVAGERVTKKAAKGDRGTKSAGAKKVAKAAKVAKPVGERKAAKAGAVEPEEVTEAPKAAKAPKVAKVAKAPEVAKVTKVTKAAKAAKAAKAGQVTKAAKAANAGQVTKAAKAAKAVEVAEVPKVEGAKATKAARSAKSIQAAQTTQTTQTTEAVQAATSTGALNDPLTFLTFVADHPVGSVFDGTVVSFTSHGAHVDVGAMRCHIPLRRLGDPAPTRARDVLAKGETRPFVLVSLDAAGRRAELGLPGFAP